MSGCEISIYNDAMSSPWQNSQVSTSRYQALRCHAVLWTAQVIVFHVRRVSWDAPYRPDFPVQRTPNRDRTSQAICLAPASTNTLRATRICIPIAVLRLQNKCVVDEMRSQETAANRPRMNNTDNQLKAGRERRQQSELHGKSPSTSRWFPPTAPVHVSPNCETEASANHASTRASTKNNRSRAT